MIAVMVIISSTIIEGIATEDHSVYASPSPPSTATLSNFNFGAVGDTNCNSIDTKYSLQNKTAKVL